MGLLIYLVLFMDDNFVFEVDFFSLFLLFKLFIVFLFVLVKYLKNNKKYIYVYRIMEIFVILLYILVKYYLYNVNDVYKFLKIFYYLGIRNNFL